MLDFKLKFIDWVIAEEAEGLCFLWDELDTSDSNGTLLNLFFNTLRTFSSSALILESSNLEASSLGLKSDFTLSRQ